MVAEKIVGIDGNELLIEVIVFLAFHSCGKFVDECVNFD